MKQQEPHFVEETKSTPQDHAWLLAQWYEEDMWSDAPELVDILEDHKMAITWSYMWYWGFIKVDPIPQGLHAGLFNAYAYVLDFYDKNPYTDVITAAIDLEID